MLFCQFAVWLCIPKHSVLARQFMCVLCCYCRLKKKDSYARRFDVRRRRWLVKKMVTLMWMIMEKLALIHRNFGVRGLCSRLFNTLVLWSIIVNIDMLVFASVIDKLLLHYHYYFYLTDQLFYDHHVSGCIPKVLPRKSLGWVVWSSALPDTHQQGQSIYGLFRCTMCGMSIICQVGSGTWKNRCTCWLTNSNFKCCDVCQPGKRHSLRPPILLCFHLVVQQLQLSLNVIRLCSTAMLMPDSRLVLLRVLR